MILDPCRKYLIVLVVCGFGFAAAASAEAQGVLVPDEPTPVLSPQDVRIGMKGYGLTVFQGTRIEPFNVEVISVVPNSSPKHSVIWIRCDDPRMVESGPVQGMSGSPIFLWGEGEAHELGQGGKLIGAFAFGFSNSQQCLVGVQPIGYMRESATRIKDADADQAAGARGSTNSVIELLKGLEHLSVDGGSSSAVNRVRLEMIRQRMQRAIGQTTVTGTSRRATSGNGLVSGPRDGVQARPLLLPMSLSSPRAAQVFGPLLEPMGILAVAPQASPIAGEPPHGIDVESTALEPGSVLAVPLAYGDLDLSAAGTVTDVLPSGAVLGFGHPMFGLGDSAVPMATGYVHFIVPLRSISFKLGGSLLTQGTLVRDESAAVAGIAEKRYTTAPVDVTVNMLGQDTRQYQYHVVNNPMLGAMLTAIVTYNSIEAVHAMPLENTARVRAELRFTGGRVIELDSLEAGGSSVGLVMGILPIVGVMVQNPYESLEIESVKVTVDIEDGNRMGTILGGRLDRAEVAPGETVAVNLEIQHYAGPTELRRIELLVPDDLDEGDYPLTVSGSNSYTMLKLMSSPQLMVTENIDDLTRFLQEMYSYRSDAIYITLQLPEQGLAVGRTEMPKLPSSQRAILQSPTRTDVMPYPRLVDKVFDSDAVINGEVSFTLSVRKP